jgi:GTP cyclohydrolase II
VAATIAGTLLHVEARPLATRHGDFTAHLCCDLGRRTYLLALARGDLATPEPLLARVHSSCVTSETYGGCDCDCAEQLDAALAAIAVAGRGVVFYLDQEGRGAGFVAKVRDRMLVQASGGRLDTFDAFAQMGLARDLRSYEGVAAAYEVLGLTAPLVLLTNNPEKLAALATVGLPVAGTTPLALPPSPFNRHYLVAKAAAGHRLAVPRAGFEAAPPAVVEAIAPYRLPDHASLVAAGSYWLPIRAHGSNAPGPRWFRLHAYVDLAGGREHVVLTYGEDATPTTPVLVRFQREALLERVPGRDLGVEARRWAATIEAFVAYGAGVAVMLGDASIAALLGVPAPDDGEATSLTLARRHLDGRRALPLVDPAEHAANVRWSAALAAAGVALEPARLLAVA